jgi:DNA-binding NarL/FixJ family response regulator
VHSSRRLATASAHSVAAPFLAQCQDELAAPAYPDSPVPSALEGLTPQEQIVIGLVCEGLANQDIAHRLVLSVKTVGYHPGNAYAKLDVHSRTQLLTRLGQPG